MADFALWVPPQTEFRIGRILMDNGIEAVVPVEYRWRRLRQRHRERKQVPIPKLKGYVFVRLEGGPVSFESILLQRYRVSYLGCHGLPQALPEGALEKVIAMSENPKPRKKAYNSHGTFRVGEKVRIVEGAFTDHVVEIEQIRGKSAVIVLELFNSKREVTIGLDELEAA